MTIHNDTHLLGRFWVAGQPDNSLPGWLDCSQPNPSVTLAGQLTPAIAVATSQSNHLSPTDREFTPESYTIHGELSQGNFPSVTIFGAICKFREYKGFPGTSSASTNGVQVFQGSWLLRGCHLLSGDTFKKAILRFNYLDDWVNKSGLVRYKWNFGEGRPVDLVYQEPYPQSALIPGGRGSVSVYFFRHIPHARPTGFRTKHHAEVQFEFNSQTLNEVYSRYVEPTLNLVSIMMNRPCHATHLQVLPEGSEYFCPVSHSLIDPEVAADKIRSEYYYLGLQHVGIGSLARWLARVNDSTLKLNPIPSIVSGAMRTDSSRFIESDILELATCIEGLDRRLNGSDSPFNADTERKIRKIAVDSIQNDIPNELGAYAAEIVAGKLAIFEPTYSERANRLLNEVQPCAPELVGLVDEWRRNMRDLRNELAHMFEDQRIPVDTKIVLRDSLRWTLGIILMLRVAGLGESVIRSRLTDNQAYKFFIRKAKDIAPAIYP